MNTNTLANISAIPLRANRGYNSSTFIIVSTGVGGGIILCRKLLISHDGLAGHVGFTTSRIAMHICGCGRDKTVESIASGRAITRYTAYFGCQDYDAKAVF